MINGVINIYKEEGFTSHDVVAKLRGILKQKKIGHTGTLDPFATGVLPVCIGNATKLCDMLTDKDKEYEAVMLLGITTDTEDITGEVLSERPVDISDEQLRNAISSFVGTYGQIPPMYSALKVNGKKMYELARAGIEVERKPREITIYSIDILNIDLPRVTMRIACKKGTYIRSLCRDIGEKLGCGACVDKLKRIRSGSFAIEEAITLEEVSRLAIAGDMGTHIKAVDQFFQDYEKIVVTDRNETLVSNGNAFKHNEKLGDFVRVYMKKFDNEVFAGIYQYDNVNDIYKPKKMFLDGE